MNVFLKKTKLSKQKALRNKITTSSFYLFHKFSFLISRIFNSIPKALKTLIVFGYFIDINSFSDPRIITRRKESFSILSKDLLHNLLWFAVQCFRRRNINSGTRAQILSDTIGICKEPSDIASEGTGILRPFSWIRV